MNIKFISALILILLPISTLPLLASSYFNPQSGNIPKTYDFRDRFNNKAFEGNDTSQPPASLEIGSELSLEEYNNISRLDGLVAEFDSGPWGSSDYHRFKFRILEPVGSIYEIYVRHYGYGRIASGGDPGLMLFIWNEDMSWELWDEHDEGYSNGIAEARLVGDFSKYIDDYGYLNVLVQAKENSGSCPFLYAYNGERYVFVADLYSNGMLAVPFYYPNPEDYLKMDDNELQQNDGYYKMQIVQEYDEISYSDRLYMMTIDHPPEVEVFLSLLKSEVGKIYTVRKDLISPITAIDEDGNDVLPKIREEDGVFTHGKQYELDIMELDLGDLSDAEEIKLVLKAYTNWDNDEVLKSGPKPYERFIQVKDEKGDWTTVLDTSELASPFALPRTYVIQLTDKFITDDYSVRIGYYFDVRFDYIGVDTSPQRDFIVDILQPVYADLHYRGYSYLEGIPTFPDYYDYKFDPPDGYSHPIGNFTRFGDVLPLLTDRDDEFVILHHGDEISLQFDYLPAEDGMERDFVLYSWGYYKGDEFPTGDTVEPLPFREMSSYPYPGNESYPYDEHMEYLKEYNTREYDESHTESDEHNTIYTDYIKVDVYYSQPVGGEIVSTNTFYLINYILMIIVVAIAGTVGLLNRKKLP